MPGSHKRAERLPAHHCPKCNRFYYEPQRKDRCPSCKRALRVIPLGAGEPLPPPPRASTVTDAEIDRAIKR